MLKYLTSPITLGALIFFMGIHHMQLIHQVEDYEEKYNILHDRINAYERYYCATEEMLDILPCPTQDSITTTKQGFRYLEEKYIVDSLCHKVLP